MSKAMARRSAQNPEHRRARKSWRGHAPVGRITRHVQSRSDVLTVPVVSATASLHLPRPKPAEPPCRNSTRFVRFRSLPVPTPARTGLHPPCAFAQVSGLPRAKGRRGRLLDAEEARGSKSSIAHRYAPVHRGLLAPKHCPAGPTWPLPQLIGPPVGSGAATRQSPRSQVARSAVARPDRAVSATG